jgi:hypothetical protein
MSDTPAPQGDTPPVPETPPPLFTDFGLAESIVRAVTELGYREPTPIQAEAIPVVMTGKDVMGRGVGVGRLLGLFEAPPGSGQATACSGDLIMGATGMICAKKPPGPGRRAWRDMRP